MLQVEFKFVLSTGAEVFVRAKVGEYVEITEVWSGEHENDVPIPYELFSVKDRIAMDEAAAEEYYAERERWSVA